MIEEKNCELPFCPMAPSWNMVHCWGKTIVAPASQPSEAGINYSGRNLQKHREQSVGIKWEKKKKDSRTLWETSPRSSLCSSSSGTPLRLFFLWSGSDISIMGWTIGQCFNSTFSSLTSLSFFVFFAVVTVEYLHSSSSSQQLLFSGTESGGLSGTYKGSA